MISGRNRTLALASALSISLAGIAFIQSEEGTEYEAYLDSVHVPTICTGSTKNVFIGQKATLQECEQRLQEDTTYAGKAVGRYVQRKLTQQQYDTLVSFVFNVGETQFYRSTLLRKINAGDCWGAGAEFDRWVYAKGKRLKGLVSRRADERKQWEEGCYLWQ